MSYRDYDRSSSGYGFLIAMVVTIAVVLVLVGVVAVSCNRVDPGYSGVIIDYGTGTVSGEPKLEPVQTGRYFMVYPWEFKRLVKYPISEQTLTMVRRVSEGKVQGDDSVECQDKNGIQVNIDSSTLWQVQPENAVKLYLKRPGLPLDDPSSENDIASLVVRREVRNAIANACSKFTYDQMYGTERVNFGLKVTEFLGPALQETYVTLNKFLLGEIYLLAAQKEAIGKVANAQQQAREAQYLAEKAENEARANVATAEGAKKVRILQAQAEAEAIRIVNEQLGQSPRYIEYVYASHWNGAYPSTVVLGNGQSIPILAGLQIQGMAPTPTPSPSPTAMPTATSAPSATPTPKK